MREKYIFRLEYIEVFRLYTENNAKIFTLYLEIELKTIRNRRIFYIYVHFLIYKEIKNCQKYPQ